MNGSEFLPGSEVRWNGDSRTTTYLSDTQLTADITADDIATADTAEHHRLQPEPGGGVSNPQTFTINNPLPVTSSISPTSRTAGQAAFTLTVNGSEFLPGSEVRWNGDSRTTTYLSDTQLTADITADDIATADTASITVFNPEPGGGVSNPQTFTIIAPPAAKPVVEKVVPSYGPPGTQVTIKGSGFGSSRSSAIRAATASYVSFNGTAATEYSTWTDTRIVCTVPEGAIPGPVYVVTGAGSSGKTMTFTVTTPTWYLAEGTTAWGFSTYITIENPNAGTVTANVTYMPTGEGHTRRRRYPSAQLQTTLTNDHLVEVMGGQRTSPRRWTARRARP